MARQARTTKSAQDPEELHEEMRESASEIEPTEAEVDHQSVVNDWIADLGGHSDAAISVYRMDPRTNKPIFIESFGVSEMDGPSLFRMLRHDYNGGKFRIQMRADGRIRKSQTVEIEPPLKRERQHDPGAGQLNIAEVIRELRSDRGNGDQTSLILESIRESNRAFQTMMVEMMKATAKKDDGPSITELVQAMAAMKQLEPERPQTDPTELILKGIELANSLGGNGAEANMYDVLKGALSQFGGTLNQALGSMPPQQRAMMERSPQRLPAPQQASEPSGEAKRPEGEAKTPEGENADADNAQKAREKPPEMTPEERAVRAQLGDFAPYLDWLVELAKQDRDPAVYANVFIDQIGEEQARQLILTPGLLETLAQAVPAVSAHLPWFVEFRSCVDEFTAGDDDAPEFDDDDGPASVDQPAQPTAPASAGARAGAADADGHARDSRRAGRDPANAPDDGAGRFSGEGDRTDSRNGARNSPDRS